MISLQPKELKALSRSLVAKHHAAQRQTVLLYTGATVLLSIAASALQLFLDHQISGTGGLSGLGTRSILQTIQTALQYALSLFSPFWHGGFLLCMLKLAADEAPQPRDLLSGFRRILPLLGYQLWRMGIVFLVALVVVQVGSTIFSFTPWSAEMMELMAPYLESGELTMEALPMEQLQPIMLPLTLIMLAILLPVSLFLDYGMRLAPYLIMHDHRFRSLSAIIGSFTAMKGHKMAMLKLDLSYWWFYLLEGVLTVVCYLDGILPLLGIALPFNPTVAYFVTLILYGVLELALHLWKKGEVEVTFALACRRIMDPLLEQTLQPQQPENPDPYA